MRYTIATLVALLAVPIMARTQQATVTRNVLQQVDLSVPGRQAVTVKAEFPSGSTTGRHTHPGEEVTYVLDGSLTIQIDGEPPRVVKAGQAFFIPAGKIHQGTATGEKATILANYIVEKGKPLVTPVQ